MNMPGIVGKVMARNMRLMGMKEPKTFDLAAARASLTEQDRGLVKDLIKKRLMEKGIDPLYAEGMAQKECQSLYGGE